MFYRQHETKHIIIMMITLIEIPQYANSQNITGFRIPKTS